MNAEPRSMWRSPILLALLLLLLTIAAYWPAIGAGYIWDDDDYLTQNPLVQDWESLPTIWEPMQTRQYYPLVFTTFWIEHKLWGFEPAGYHLVNIVLHALNAMLIWRIARWLKIPGAWLIAAVFALHPVHVESVAWITERKNVLSGALYLAAMLFYLKFDAQREAGDRAAWCRYAIALLCFAGALFSKTVAASLPVAIVILLLFKRESLSVRRLWPLVPMLLLGLALGLNTAHVEEVNVGTVGPEFDFTWVERCLIASRALLFYPWKLVLPEPLCFFYPRWVIDPRNWMQFLPIVIVLAATGVLVWLWMRRVRAPLCAAAFYAVTIFPALGFVSVYPMKYSFVADHFQYLASLGVIAGVVGSLAWLLHTRKWAPAIGALVLVVLGVLTFRQTHIYRDEETLWRDTIDCNPTAWAAMNNLGAVLLRKSDALMNEGRTDEGMQALTEAEPYLREALARKPDHSRARSQLSEVLRMHGRIEDALAEMQQSHAHLLASQEWMNEQQRERAAYEVAESHYQLARLHNLLSQFDEAESHYRAALASFPNFPAAHVELASMLASLGRLDDAAAAYRDLLAQVPNAVVAHRFLGDYERDHGHWTQAMQHYRAIMNSTADAAEQLRATDRMARLLATCPDASMRNGASAVELAGRVVSATQGQSVFPLATLAAAYAEMRDFDRAVSAAENAIHLAEQLGMQDAVTEITPQLESYRAGKPWRMPAPANSQ